MSSQVADESNLNSAQSEKPCQIVPVQVDDDDVVEIEPPEQSHPYNPQRRRIAPPNTPNKAVRIKLEEVADEMSESQQKKRKREDESIASQKKVLPPSKVTIKTEETTESAPLPTARPKSATNQKPQQKKTGPNGNAKTTKRGDRKHVKKEKQGNTVKRSNNNRLADMLNNILSDVLLGDSGAINNKLEEVQKLFEQLVADHRVSIDKETFSNLMNYYLHFCHQVDLALTAFEQMRKRYGGDEDLFSKELLIAMFTACCNEYRFEDSFRLLENMKADGLGPPDDIIYNTVILTCIRCHQTESAFQVLDEMKESFESRKYPFKPDWATYNLLIIECCRIGNLDKAFSLLDELDRDNNNDPKVKREADDEETPQNYHIGRLRTLLHESTQHALITACAKYGRLDQSLEWYEQDSKARARKAADQGIRIKQEDGSYKIVPTPASSSSSSSAGVPPLPQAICLTLINSCFAENRIERAFAIFEKMKRDGLVCVNAYNTIMHGCRKAHLNDKVLELFEEMKELPKDKDVRPDDQSYTIAIGACISHTDDKVERALELFAEMKERKGSGARQNVNLYHALIHYCGKHQRTDKAFELFEEMKSQHSPRNSLVDEITYKLMINACVNSDRLSQALKLFKMMRKERNGGPRGQRRVVGDNSHERDMYNLLLKGCSKEARFETAVQLIGQMKDEKIGFDLVTYHFIVSCCVTCGKLGKAIEYCFEAQNGGDDDDRDDEGEDGVDSKKNIFSMLTKKKPMRIQLDPSTYAMLIAACEKEELLSRMEIEAALVRSRHGGEMDWTNLAAVNELLHKAKARLNGVTISNSSSSSSSFGW